MCKLEIILEKLKRKLYSYVYNNSFVAKVFSLFTYSITYFEIWICLLFSDNEHVWIIFIR